MKCRLILIISIALTHPVFASPKNHEIFNQALRLIQEESQNRYQVSSIKQQFQSQVEDALLWENPIVQIVSGPMRENTVNGSQTLTTVLQPIPLYNRRGLRADERKAEGEKITFLQKMRQLELEHSMVKIIYELWASKEELSHAREREASLAPVAQHLSSLLSLSPQQVAERTLIQARVDLVKRESQLAKERYKLKKEEFNLGLPFLTSEVTPYLPEGSSENDFKKALHKLLDQSSTQEQATELEMKRLEYERSYIKTKRNPDIRLAVSTQSQFADSTQNAIMLGLDMTLPWLNTGKSQLVAKNAEIDAITSLREATKVTTQKDKKNLESSLFSSLSEIASLDKSYLKKRKSQLDEVSLNLERGTIDTRLFLDLEDDTASLHERWVKANLNAIESWSELLKLTGNSFSHPGDL